LSQKKVRAVNEAVIVAWDVNKDAFRSFRVENVVSFS
jgi:predicted DNA-binding transcriptional regulator YafY